MAYDIVDIKEETLDSKPSVSKDEVKIETISIETVQVPEYNYGTNQDTLDGPVSVRGVLNTISTTAYGSTWNGDTTTVPSKDAIYDQLETMKNNTKSDNLLLMGA